MDPNGTVLVGSEMWSATSLSNLKINTGKSVVVSNYDGVRLIVSEKSERYFISDAERDVHSRIANAQPITLLTQAYKAITASTEHC